MCFKMQSTMSLSVQKVPGKCVGSLAASKGEKVIVNIKVHGICVRLHPGRPVRVANEEYCRCALFLGKGKDTFSISFQLSSCVAICEGKIVCMKIIHCLHGRSRAVNSTQGYSSGKSNEFNGQ